MVRWNAKHLDRPIRLEKAPRAVNRMLAVQRVISGTHTIRRAAKMAGVMPQTVDRWVARYLERGPEALRDGPGGLRDRPRQATVPEDGLATMAREADALCRQGRLTPKNLLAAIAKKTGYTYTQGHANTTLRSLGYSKSDRRLERPWARAGEQKASARLAGDRPTKSEIRELAAASEKRRNARCKRELTAVHMLVTGNALPIAASITGVGERAIIRWTWAFLELGLGGILSHPKLGDAPIIKPEQIGKEAEALLREGALMPDSLRGRVKARHGVELVHVHAILHALGYARPKARFIKLWDKKPGPKGGAQSMRRKAQRAGNKAQRARRKAR